MALRALSCRGDLWLDEIWSLALLSKLNHWYQVFALYHDNNHILNSLLMYLLGPGLESYCYRGVSFISGVLTLWFVWLAIARRSSGERALTLFFLSFSYLLILYSGEARGYSLALACVAAVWLLLQHCQVNKFSNHHIASALAVSSIGCAAHGSFVGFLGIAAPYFLFSAWRLRSSFNDRVQAIVLAAGLTLVGALSWLLFYRYLPPSSGPRGQIFDVAISTLSLLSGGPEPSAWSANISILALSYAAISIVMIAIGWYRSWRTDRSEALLFFLLTFILPIVAVVVRGGDVLFPRYFLVSVLFGSILAARGLYFILAGAQQSHPVGARLIGAILICMVIAGQFAHISRLNSYSRGESLRFLATIASSESPVRVAGNHRFRDSILIDYFNSFVRTPAQAMIEYRENDDPEVSACLVQSQDIWQPQQEKISCGQAEAKLSLSTYSTGESGWNWFKYTR